MPIPFLHLETRPGEPVLVGKSVVIPVSQVFYLQVAGVPAGFVWNRPTAVKVKHADGQEQVIPVPDVTRLALLGILAFSLLFAMLFAVLSQLFHKK